MRTSLPRVALSTGACLILALSLFTPNAIAKDKKGEALEAYSGHTLNPNPGSAQHMNFVHLEIHRWTTDEERQGFLNLLAEKGSEAMVKSMRDDAERVGWVRLPDTVSYDLKYAREIQTADGRQIVLATDRPLSMGEVAFNARTLDYGATIIEFVMPADGKAGEGLIIVGAELKLGDSGKLTIENVSMNPVRFNDVKQKK